MLNIHPWLLLLLLLESLQLLRAVAERTGQRLATAQCQPVWVHIPAVTLNCFSSSLSLFLRLLRRVQYVLPKLP